MIVVIGEALIDLIEDKSTAGRYQAVVGGANANVAIALARAGTKQQLLARISSDAFGQKIRQRLVDNKVGLDYAIAAKEPTSVAIASIGSSGGASYSFYVENTADWGWTNTELPTQQTMNAIGTTALQFGCLTMAMPPGNAVVEAWARDYFDKDLLTLSHDVNVRPALGFDRDSERVRVQRVNSFSHLIKASDDDINWLYGLEPGTNVDQIAWDWIGDSAKIVFVTRGGDGASIYRRNKTKLDVASRKVKVQDSVGAGDTFCANTLAQLQQIGALGSGAFERLAALSDKQLIAIAKVSSVAASMACEKTGAEPPTDSELADLLVLLA
ncbi:RbsK Sugar kinases, ribokinase family [Microbacteriaceae bacterium]